MPSFRTTRRVPFTTHQMFELVADVERYPEFVPLCQSLKVRQRTPKEDGTEIVVADMTVGYKAIRETFRSRVRLDRGRCEVSAAGVAGAMGPFSQLENRWQLRDTPGGCEVDFYIAYELRSAMLQMLVGALFERAFRRYTEAFEERARQIYGVAAPAARKTS